MSVNLHEQHRPRFTVAQRRALAITAVVVSLLAWAALVYWGQV